MSINIESKENQGPLKLLTWDQINFSDAKEKEHPVKGITIHIEAGGIATMIVERHTMNGLFNAVSDDYKDGHKPLTYKVHYGIGDFSADIKLSSSPEVRDRLK
ncbi:MAG: hypothetical protein WCK90_06470 [archaeon]